MSSFLSGLKRIAVFASGFGSNLQALIDSQNKNYFNGKIVLVFSNNESAYAIQRAKNSNIKTECFLLSDFNSRSDFDKKIIYMLKENNIDLIVLAGYMLLLGEEVIKQYRYKILNIHPALLPAFKGTHGIKDAFDYGVKVTGVTVHFVDEGLDTGPIILQEPVIIEDNDTLETLEEKIHKVEHKMYPYAVKLFCENRLLVEGRRVKIVDVNKPID